MLKIEIIVLCEQASSLNYLNSERMAELLQKKIRILFKNGLINLTINYMIDYMEFIRKKGGQTFAGD